MKIISFLIICTAFLYAESNNLGPTLVFDSKSFDRDHESAYGVTNSYTFLVAEYQLHTDKSLNFYYGTMLGLVYESYTAENGFGQDAEQYGANIGVNYDLQQYQQLSFEGSHSQDELHQQINSQFKLQYQYTF